MQLYDAPGINEKWKKIERKSEFISISIQIEIDRLSFSARHMKLMGELDSNDGTWIEWIRTTVSRYRRHRKKLDDIKIMRQSRLKYNRPKPARPLQTVRILFEFAGF